MNIVGALVEWQTHKRYSRGWISLMLWAWSNLGEKIRTLTKQHYSTGRHFWFVGEISISQHDPMVNWKTVTSHLKIRRLKAPKMKWIIFEPFFLQQNQRGASELFLWPGLGWTTLLVCRFPARTQGPFTKKNRGGGKRCWRICFFSNMMKETSGLGFVFLGVQTFWRDFLCFLFFFSFFGFAFLYVH